MTDLPAAGIFTDPATTNAEAKQAQEDIRAFMAQVPGGQASSTLIIAAGSITPNRAYHHVDTEGATAADDLTHLAVASLPSGSWVLLEVTDPARVVTLKHAAGGSGQMLLATAADFALDTLGKWVLLRRDGTDWEEMTRGFGADLAAFRTYLGLAFAAFTNVAQSWTKPQRAGEHPLGDITGSVAIDVGAYQDFTATTTGNITLANPANIAAAINQKGTISIDNTGDFALSGLGTFWKRLHTTGVPTLPAGPCRIDYHVRSGTRIEYSFAEVEV